MRASRRNQRSIIGRDVKDWVSRVDSLTGVVPTQSANAVNRFNTGMIYDGFRRGNAIVQYCIPFAVSEGSSTSAIFEPLWTVSGLTPAQSSLSTARYSLALGYDFNGTEYYNTGFAPSRLGNNDAHMGAYITRAFLDTTNDNTIGCRGSGTSRFRWYFYRPSAGGGFYTDMGDANVGINGTRTLTNSSTVLLNRNSSGLRMTINGVLDGTAGTNSVAHPTGPVWLGGVAAATQLSISAGEASADPMSWFSIGLGMTSLQELTYRSRVTTLQAALGR